MTAKKIQRWTAYRSPAQPLIFPLEDFGSAPVRTSFLASLLNINIGIGDCFTTYLLRGEIRFNVSYGIIQQYIQYQPIRF